MWKGSVYISWIYAAALTDPILSWFSWPPKFVHSGESLFLTGPCLPLNTNDLLNEMLRRETFLQSKDEELLDVTTKDLNSNADNAVNCRSN